MKESTSASLFDGRFAGNLDEILANEIEEQRARVKQRRVHVVANLGRSHAPVDVIEGLANLFIRIQRLRPSRIEFKESSFGRNDRAIAGPFVDAIDAVHDHRSGIDRNADHVLGQRLVVEELKMRFVPDE